VPAGATIRIADAVDAERLAPLKLRLFRETFLTGGFDIPYPPADLARFERESYAPAQVAAELADAGHRTWIAEREGVAAGYAHVGPCKLPHAEVRPDAAELYQLYVGKEAQGLGIGGKLLRRALDHLVATRPGPIWLGVWSGNLRAQAIYAAQGFRKVGEYRFPVGDWHDHEFIFRRD